MRADPTACPTNRDIWNAVSKIKKGEYDGKRLIDFLFLNLKESDWTYDARFNKDNRLDALFLANPRSIQMARRFHHVAIMDSTYKMNKYEWPMFQVVGVTSTHKTFTIAMSFLARENDSYYCWAIECLLKHMWSQDNVPPFLITDREKALAKALKKVTPSS